MANTKAPPDGKEVVGKALRAVAADLDFDCPRVKSVEIRLIADQEAVYRVNPREGDQQIGGMVTLS